MRVVMRVPLSHPHTRTITQWCHLLTSIPFCLTPLINGLCHDGGTALYLFWAAIFLTDGALQPLQLKNHPISTIVSLQHSVRGMPRWGYSAVPFLGFNLSDRRGSSTILQLKNHPISTIVSLEHSVRGMQR